MNFIQNFYNPLNLSSHLCIHDILLIAMNSSHTFHSFIYYLYTTAILLFNQLISNYFFLIILLNLI